MLPRPHLSPGGYDAKGQSPESQALKGQLARPVRRVAVLSTKTNQAEEKTQSVGHTNQAGTNLLGGGHVLQWRGESSKIGVGVGER